MSAVYDADVSEVYDLLYAGRGQDFAGDADTLVATIRDRHPAASSVLDVACGTGEHLLGLARHLPQVAGLEMSPAMCAIARAKLPGSPVHEADMRSFDLGRRFDAVTCLTSSMGYMGDEDELRAAVSAMARHLLVGGVLVIDPYWTPCAFLDGHLGRELVHSGDRAVARLSRSTRRGRTVSHQAHYLIATPDGIRHVEHDQTLTLFTRTQYLDAISSTGLRAEHLPAPGGFAARGLLLGVREE